MMTPISPGVSEALASASPTPRITPSSGAAGVVSVFAVTSAPSGRSSATSVKVPPISTASRAVFLTIIDGNGIVERRPAAVGENRLPGDVARHAAGEKERDRGDLRRVADAAQRRARQNPAARSEERRVGKE